MLRERVDDEPSRYMSLERHIMSLERLKKKSAPCHFRGSVHNLRKRHPKFGSSIHFLFFLQCILAGPRFCVIASNEPPGGCADMRSL